MICTGQSTVLPEQHCPIGWVTALGPDEWLALGGDSACYFGQ